MNTLAKICRIRAWLPAVTLSVFAVTTLAAHAQSQYTFLSTFGTLGSGAGQFVNPEDVKIDSNGNIFVVDSGNNRVEKFDANANFLTAFGSHGSGGGQFNQPLGIGIDNDNNIFVADTNNDRVLEFTNSGQAIGNPQVTIGRTGVGNGQFRSPVGVAFDSSNTLFVVDSNNSRVQEFTQNTNDVYQYSSQFGSQGNGNGQFTYPYRLGLDNAGNVFVADTLNHRVDEFNSTGAFVRSFAYSNSNDTAAFDPQGIAVDKAGNVFVTDFLNNRVIKFSNSGVYLDQFGTAGTGNGQFQGADGIAVDSVGNVYVTDLNNNRVEVFGVTPVPEMGSLFMFASMTAGGLFLARRRNRHAT